MTDWLRFHVSLGVWGFVLLVFLGLELPPVFWPGCPWETLSGTVWDAQSAWHPARAFVAVFLLVLALHFAAKVPAGWLITVAVGTALALGTHLLLVKVLHVHPGWL